MRRNAFRIHLLTVELTPSRKGNIAFTLVELLVSITILIVLLVVMFQMIASVGSIWKSGSGTITAFQNARSAFTTITQCLACSTLNTYTDYVDASGNSRTGSKAATFVPAQFTRASELHFLSGPASALLGAAGSTISNPADFPGDAVFFQGLLGFGNDTTLAGLTRKLNSVGFYIDYEPPDSRLIPSWLQPLMGKVNRFRLLQFVQPSENASIYNSTAKSAYDLGWLSPFNTPSTAAQPRARVLANDVLLLVLRPRLSPKDEATIAPELGMTYNSAASGSILCPNYYYDSRAWESGYPPGQRVMATSSPTQRSQIMRNQLPPIVDVAMIAADPQTLVHFGQISATPPAQLQLPSALFTDSSKFDQDLETYGQQLASARIRFHIFRISVQIQGAKWSNN